MLYQFFANTFPETKNWKNKISPPLKLLHRTEMTLEIQIAQIPPAKNYQLECAHKQTNLFLFRAVCVCKGVFFSLRPAGVLCPDFLIPDIIAGFAFTTAIWKWRYYLSQIENRLALCVSLIKYTFIICCRWVARNIYTARVTLSIT